MAVSDIVPAGGESFERALASASRDTLRAIVRVFARKMMDAEVEVACNADYGEVTPARVNSRNGCRMRERDTWAGTVQRSTADGPSGRWIRSSPRRILLGVLTRRVKKLAVSLGVARLS